MSSSSQKLKKRLMPLFLILVTLTIVLSGRRWKLIWFYWRFASFAQQKTISTSLCLDLEKFLITLSKVFGHLYGFFITNSDLRSHVCSFC